MLHKSFKPAKCKTSLRLAVPRIKLLRNKKDVQIKQLKGELAKLLETGQDQTARIRVEHVIREEKTKEAYELIEIFCELIVARMPIIESQKNCPLDLKEAVTSVIFASPRCADIPELIDVRKQFTAKYGKEFTSAAVELRPECGVSRMLVEKLSAKAPDGPTKIKILSAIAKEYHVKWEPKDFEEKIAIPPTDLLNGPSTFEKASRIQMESIDVHPIYHDIKGPHNVQFPPEPEKKHDKPADFNLQNPGLTPHSRNSSSGNISINSGSYNPEVRHSEINSARPEFTYSPSSGEKWTMEFKDATSAAQAAAESAERASMAARAAAELSIRGKMTQQYSSTSQNSSVHMLRDENRREFSTSKLPNQDIPKDPVNTASYGGYRMSNDPSDRDAKTSYRANDHDTERRTIDNYSKLQNEHIPKDPESTSHGGSWMSSDPSDCDTEKHINDNSYGGYRMSNDPSDRDAKISYRANDRDTERRTIDNYSKLQNEHIPKDPESTSYGGSWMSSDPFDCDTEKHINDNSSADNFKVADKNPKMMQSEPELNNQLGRFEKRYSKSEMDYVSEQQEVDSESRLYCGEERIGKKSSRRPHSQRSFSNDDDDAILDNNKSGSDDAGENPFVNDDHNQGSVSIESSLHANTVVFDDSASDDDHDVQSKDQIPKSSFSCQSPDRISTKNSLSSENPWNPSQIIVEDPPLFSESSSTMGPSQKDDPLEVAFDHSEGPSSESEEEMEKFKINEIGKYPSKQSVDFINPELSQDRSFGLAGSSEEKKFGYGDSPSAGKSFLNVYPSMQKAKPINSDLSQSVSYGLPRSSEEKKLGYGDSPRLVNSSLNVFNEVDEESDQWTRKSSKSSRQHEATDHIYRPGSSETEKDTQISEESSLESVNELNFGKLRGGFRNQKGYIRPSYVKNPSKNALSFKKSSENSDSQIEKPPTQVISPTFGLNQESYNQRISLQVSQKSSLKLPMSDQNDDDSDDDFADHNESSKNIAVEMNEKTTPKVAIKYDDSRSSDSDEDFRVQTIKNKPSQNVGVSRRTKGSSLYTGSSPRSPSTPDFETERKSPSRRSSEPSSKTETQYSSSKPENFRSDKQSRFAEQVDSKTPPEPRRSSKEEKLKLSTQKEKPSISIPNTVTEKTIERLNSSSGGSPSSEKSAHVHPKLPDYDSFTAHFQSLRKNRQ